jgi:2-methylcitrate dehydratase PrpD
MPAFHQSGQEDPMHTLIRMALGLSYEDLPSAVRTRARQAILDTMAVTIGGSTMEGIPDLVDFVKEKGGKPESLLPFYGGRLPASETGLALGPMSRAMDLGDIHEEAGHCSEYILPALLASAGLKARVTGKELITAFVVGSEVLVRIGVALKTLTRAFPSGRYPGHFIFGCVGAVAKLLELSRLETENAQGIVSTMTQPNTRTIYTYPSQMVAFHHGFICQGAINACLLAKRGVTGPRQVILAPPLGYLGLAKWEIDPEALLKGLGETWEMLNNRSKLYPAVIVSQGAIGCTADLMGEEGLHADDIAGIEIVRAHLTKRRREEEWNPQTVPECQFSSPFAVATAAYDGGVFVESYSPEARQRPKVRDLMSRTSLVVDPGLSDTATGINIKLRDGKEYSRECLYPKGHPANSLTDAELVGKLKQCARFSAFKLTTGAIDALAEKLLNLERVNDAEGELLAPLTPG